MSLPFPRLLAALLCSWTALAGLTSCSATVEDKRVLQYLNQNGFGKRYYGDAQEQNYVSIGDTIQFIDTYNEEARGSAVVDIDGTILLPEVGSVWVAGYTRTELESYLTQKLSPYFVETDVKVTIRTGGKKVFYVMGEVARRGPHPYTGDLTLFEAVLAAAPTDFGANLGRVRLIRADPRDPLIITADVSKFWTSGDSTYNIQVKEYDIIYVPPTLLQAVADLISGLIVPATSVLKDVWQAIWWWDNPQLGYGNRRRNQNY